MRLLSLGILLLSLIVSSTLSAEALQPRVLKTEGKVLLYPGNSIRALPLLTTEVELHWGDKLRTLYDGKITVEAGEGQVIVVENNTQLVLLRPDTTQIEQGIAVFDIKKQEAQAAYKVETRAATIGVKGTRFAVRDSEQATQVFLKTGTLNVEAVRGEFMQRKREAEDAVQSYKDEFAEYKKQLEEEFIEYKKSIVIEAGTAISIGSDNELKQAELKGLDSLFDQLDQWAE